VLSQLLASELVGLALLAWPLIDGPEWLDGAYHLLKEIFKVGYGYHKCGI
jgi:hypothetical protein